MQDWLNRTEYLIGKENLDKLKKSHVAVFGCGGVGSYTIEALARSGIGHITIVDKDVVDITNINRQLIADTTTIGMPKVEVAKERLLKINPDIEITTYQTFYNTTNANELLGIYNDNTKDLINTCNGDSLSKTSNACYDYIVDAIDTVSSKVSLIEEAYRRNIPIISCMGTGNKLDPTKFEVVDISKTSVCPLAKVIRKELSKRGIEHLKVVYSKEEPHRVNEDDKRTPASISFVPSVAGLILAGEVVKDLLK